MSKIAQLITRAVAGVPAPGRDRTIHLALSGGVDSSVAGFLLRERGYDVRGVFLRCWTSEDGACVERERRAASAAAAHLGLVEGVADWDFVREYWLSVFEPVLLGGLAGGLTPNPDVACNARLKFGAFPRRLRARAGAGARFATGHYARLDAAHRLRRAADPRKDQSYFLAHVDPAALRGAVFPLGALHKPEVRAIARHVGLPAAAARSSRGLCFVGARRLSELLRNYIDDAPTPLFVDADTGAAIVQAPLPAWAYTVGQRARIGGVSCAYYVADKCSQENVVLVASGSRSPHLYTHVVHCNHPRWLVHDPPLNNGTPLLAKLMSSGPLEPCTVQVTDSGLSVHFDHLVRRVGAGQVVALYHNDLCLGGATIALEPFPRERLSQTLNSVSIR